MKKCSICNIEKEVNDFEPLRTQCKTCRAAKKKISRARWYQKNKKHAIQYSKEWREQNEERRKEYRKKEYAKNAEQAKEASRQYRKDNRPKVNAWARMRQCEKARRTPKWLTDDDKWIIEQAYELAALRTKMFGFDWEVDHVIPLRGKNVSGLHVPTNLQVIPATENKVKRNFFKE